jgi:hypothetical protein
MSSVRKHYSQLSSQESTFLWRQLLEVEKWNPSNHFKDKLYERGGELEAILDALHESSIVEYHLRNNFSRVLVRSVRAFNGYVPCIVFQPKTKTIITMYWNHERDNHSTINMGAYTKEIDVFSSWENSL